MRRVTKTLRDLLADVWSRMDVLRDELQEWADDLPPTPKRKEIEDAIAGIENVFEFDCPTAFEKLEVTWAEERAHPRKSRPERRDDCTIALLAAIHVLRREDMAENAGFLQELEEAVEEYESIRFPGMH